MGEKNTGFMISLVLFCPERVVVDCVLRLRVSYFYHPEIDEGGVVASGDRRGEDSDHIVHHRDVDLNLSRGRRRQLKGERRG